MNTKVDAYIARSKKWPEAMTALRAFLLDSGLVEELKWGKPCYAHDGKNIAIVQEMNDFVALMFFKGALLTDTAGILEPQGPNSRSALRIRFTCVEDVGRLAGAIREYVNEAIEVEKAGLTVGPAPKLVLVKELQDHLDSDPAFKTAFEGLTPGRRREYHLFVSGAKQASTRAARVETHIERIMEGRGLRDSGAEKSPS